jgi:hypothetical protein
MTIPSAPHVMVNAHYQLPDLAAAFADLRRSLA